MITENIIAFIISLAVAVFMIGIGIFQLKSKKPVGFYSGEQPPDENELSDVNLWNKKHGIMWIVYGMLIIFSYGIGIIIGDDIWSVIFMCGGVIIPMPIMVLYHHRLVNIYKN